MEEKIEKLSKIINESNNIVVFSGAGISVPSGIPDFRSSDGLYNQKSEFGVPPEEVISHHFFEKRTKDFYKFYKEKMIFSDAKPNIAHEYFAELEKLGKVKAVVTQNIDGLHEKAGSKNVFELHGSIYKNHCTKCRKKFDINYVISSNAIPLCDKCGGIIKPDVVLYEEPLDIKTMDGALLAISKAETLIVVGTSLLVQPAASFISYFHGKDLVLINKSQTPYDQIANLVINDDIVSVIEKLKKINQK